jgi:RNA polymerase sigma factor (sigma-70 family)
MTEDEIPVIFLVHARQLAGRGARKWHFRIPAEDLRQSALLAAVLAFRSFDPAKLVPIHIWIKTKMAYAVIDALRYEFHIRSGSLAAGESIPATAEMLDGCPEKLRLPARDNWPATEAAMNIGVALESLNPRQREVIERRYFRGETQLEIATDLGCHFSWVSQIEKAACLKMRSAFIGSVCADRYATAAA